MEEVIHSMVRFSAALTVFGVQQLQNAMEAVTDSEAALKKFQASLDSMTKAIDSRIDPSNRSTLDSVSRLGADLVDSMNVRALDPRELVQTTSDLVRKTTDSFADLVKKPAAETPPRKSHAAADAPKSRAT